MHTDPNTGGSRPVPDPTLLTTQQLDREVMNLRSIIETRLNGMDHATDLIKEATNRIPSDVDTKVGNLRELNKVKFEAIDTQFTERDKRVEAAFDAAKDAAIKLEGSTTKLVDQLDSKIADLKDRVTRIEAGGLGQNAQRITTQQSNSFVVAVIAVCISFVGILIVIAKMLIG